MAAKFKLPEVADKPAHHMLVALLDPEHHNGRHGNEYLFDTVCELVVNERTGEALVIPADHVQILDLLQVMHAKLANEGKMPEARRRKHGIARLHVLEQAKKHPVKPAAAQTGSGTDSVVGSGPVVGDNPNDEYRTSRSLSAPGMGPPQTAETSPNA